MLIYVLQVLFAAIRTVSRSALNIMLYSMLSRIFNQWFGFNTLISFFCSAYCLSKIVGYFQRLWQNARLTNKKPDEKIVLDELTWESPTTIANRVDNQTESTDKFETDWKYLLDDDSKTIFPSIVDIPFKNGWLFFATLMVIDYQQNSLNYSYTISLLRTIAFLIVLISGASIRYQTLFERDKTNFFNLMIKKRDEIERYIVYSKNNVPIASVCLQIMNISETQIFMVQLCQLNSKFNDYIYDIGNYICQKLIERIKISGDEDEKSIRLIWSLPTCKQKWMFAIKANKFLLKNTYKDFSFMPLVNSYVQQYEYFYEYKNLPSEIIGDETIEKE